MAIRLGAGDALLAEDVQNDFLPGGKLAVDAGDAVVPALNRYLGLAKKLGLPVIGVVDSNNSPELIDYVVPGNDDAIRSIRLYAQGIADAILDGRRAVAHIGAGEGDEFIELDESGMPVAKVEDEASSRIKVKKKVRTPKKAEPAATAEVVAELEQDPADGAEEKGQSDTGNDKKTVRKKAARKKTTKNKANTRDRLQLKKYCRCSPCSGSDRQ